MSNNKTPIDTYSASRYNNLHAAICQHGTAMHRELWDLFVEAGFSKKQIFTKYMKMLRNISIVNHGILRSVGVRHFLFDAE